MANTNNHAVNMTWGGGATSTALNTNNRVSTDFIYINANAVQGAVIVSANNAGAAAVGDYVEVWAAWSVDGSAFDTEEHAQYLGRLNTVSAEDPGENPARKTFALNVSGKFAVRVIVRANQGASRAVSVFAVYNEHRMS